MTIHGHNIAALHQGARPDVVSAIRQASAQTGVDFAYLLEKAATESSFNPAAQAPTSSARGLYQFIDRTWLDTMDRHGAKHGYPNVAAAITRDAHGNPVVADADTKEYILSLRDDPRVSALMAAEFARDNEQSLEQSLGRDVGKAELYMAHFLGAGGAAKFLSEMQSNGDAEACAIVPAAARANAAVFYDGNKALSLEEVYARFERKFPDDAAGRQHVPTALAAVTAPAVLPANDAARLARQAAIIAAVDPAFAARGPRHEGNSSRHAQHDSIGGSVDRAMGSASLAGPDQALVALQALQSGPELRAGGAVRPDLAAQLFTLSLLQAFDRPDDEQNAWLA
ncbi:MAG TPA: transglycosylase SLT domain-containing protein [Pseudomonadales bacterium]